MLKLKTGTTLIAAVVIVACAGLAGARFAFSDSRAELDRIAEVLQVTPGATVADVGAGDGRFTIDLARRVSSNGRVYATEIDVDRRKEIQQAVSRQQLHNVSVVEGGAQDSRLAAACCDAILIRDVYHHFTDPMPMNASLYAALRPEGLMAIIDFEPRWWLTLVSRPKGVPANRGGHGMPKELLVKEVTAAGFVMVRVINDWPRGSYCVVFRRRARQQS
jgi:ubiquinone/menaquinone biosynthesis C-methylase UbiE